MPPEAESFYAEPWTAIAWRGGWGPRRRVTHQRPGLQRLQKQGTVQDSRDDV
jgi:hypothetical protein